MSGLMLLCAIDNLNTIYGKNIPIGHGQQIRKLDAYLISYRLFIFLLPKKYKQISF